jgi:glycosidase
MSGIQLILACLLSALATTAQQVYPTNWWVGMKHSRLQVMIHAPGIGDKATVTVAYPGVRLTEFHRVSNPNYLFIRLQLAPTVKPGNIPIRISHDGSAPTVIQYPLLARRSGKGVSYAQGVTSADFIYFLMPDRFSNGDPDNDRVAGLRDQSLNRDSIFLRHGGDMQGIINHLDYLQQLGVTTLWMTPVLLNDMPDRTEHGYAFTDHYTIDPRLGGAAQYRRLSDSLHRRGMKLIQDAVYNHVGLYHLFIQDLPEKSWLHQWPGYTQTNYRDQPLLDPHASAGDRKLTSDGWFTPQMPDLNQANRDLAEFLIQHALWCVETFGVDGWRIDTYIYNDLDFMNRCNKELLDEYPHITMFGEAWVHGFFSQVGEDLAAQKMGLLWLLTTRGIPQLYYGTEILMKGFANPDGWVRLDFPGGWPGDRINAFTGEGLTEDQRQVQQLVRRMGQFRLHSSALRTGRLMQYTPDKSLYVYFRYDAGQTILCAMNTGNRPVSLDFSRFAERMAGFRSATDVLTGERRSVAQPAEIPGRTMRVMELSR